MKVWYLVVLAGLLWQASCQNLQTRLRNTLVGSDNYRSTFVLPFDPLDGARNRRSYQIQYGVRGKNLIEQIGLGFSKPELVRIGAIPP
ncbi:uncharacterized protein [Anabrus simplex]|uniref:uncharacterized protein n=1 Tax=Anabrus simplex TaxID=316456 RepID=UPI0035A34DEF